MTWPCPPPVSGTPCSLSSRNSRNKHLIEAQHGEPDGLVPIPVLPLIVDGNVGSHYSPRASASSFIAWGCRCYCARCLFARAAVGIKMRGVLKAVSPVLVPAVVMTMTFVSKGSGPPTSGPLHLLFPLPGMSSMLIPALSDVSSPSIHLMLPKIPVFASSISTTFCNSMSSE